MSGGCLAAALWERCPLRGKWHLDSEFSVRPLNTEEGARALGFPNVEPPCRDPGSCVGGCSQEMLAPAGGDPCTSGAHSVCM